MRHAIDFHAIYAAIRQSRCRAFAAACADAPLPMIFFFATLRRHATLPLDFAQQEEYCLHQTYRHSTRDISA